jgi:PPOX class probable F420-dependent enzyme
MATLPESARALLSGAPLAHVVTINRSGTPQVSGTWVSLDGDALVIASLYENRKVKNLRRDPRVVISFESPGKNAMGLTEYLVIHGRATVEEGGAPEILQAQARVYMGPDVKFPPADNPPPGFVIRVQVERVSGVGPWVGGWG